MYRNLVNYSRLKLFSGNNDIANIEYLSIFTKLASGDTIGILAIHSLSIISNNAPTIPSFSC